MAKKEKVTLTPEEIEAKKARKKEKRGIFGKTFERALAWFLAVVFVYCVAYIASGKTATVATAGPANQNTASTTSAANKSQWDTSANGNGSSNGASTSNGDAAQSNTGTAQGDNASQGNAASSDAEAIVKAINEATAAAADGKAGYNWERKGAYTDDGAIKVTTSGGKDATSILNGAISKVASDASLDSVVGGFLGIGNKNAVVTKGNKAADDMKEIYAIKAAKLQAGDISIVSQKDGVYSIKIKDSSNPQRDEATAFAKFSDDYLTESEVAQEIKNAAKGFISLSSATVDYSEISAVVTIKDGKVTDMTYNYTMSADLTLKVIVTDVNGTGKGVISAHYSNFQY